MLLNAARELFSNASASDLARDYQSLSDLYRRELPTPTDITQGEVAAYAAARLPATSAVIARVLREVRGCIPSFQPITVLDLGAGLGPAGWAAAECFPSVDEVDFVERAPRMLAAGRSLSESAPVPAVARARWHATDATSQFGVHDLVMASYLLAELPPGRGPLAIERWWQNTGGCLVVIEPGSPAGYRRLMTARSLLVERGATVAAPCPHERACPLDGTEEWCRFNVRLARSDDHRQAKAAVVGHEDESYSYVVATRRPTVRSARLLDDPSLRTGHVRLRVCADEGLQEIVVSRREPRYRAVRRAEAGDRLTS
jgi:ribosomal protein RSM22 (predicted rRNA methylase)